MKNLLMYAGQGSQYYQMGRTLYAESTCFKHMLDKINCQVIDFSGIDVLSELYNDRRLKSEPFDNLLLSHFGIFMVEYALTQTLIEHDIYPDYVLGASLGEITAACVAGLQTIDQSLQLLINNAESINRYCSPGGMIAIIDSIDETYNRSVDLQQCDIAAINYDQHFLISGDESSIQQAQTWLIDQSIIHQRLVVNFGFHSQAIDPAKGAIEFCVNNLKFRSQQSGIKMISSATSSIVNTLNADHYWQVFRKPIYFRKTLEYFGAENIRYIDVSPSSTLAVFAKYHLASQGSNNCFSIMTPYGNEMAMIQRISQFSIGN